MCQSLAVYLKKLPCCQNLSFGQGWSESTEDLNKFAVEPGEMVGKKSRGGKSGTKRKLQAIEKGRRKWRRLKQSFRVGGGSHQGGKKR